MATKLPALTYLRYWQMAAAQEIGIMITTSDRILLVNALYECRKQSGGFEDLMIFQPVFEGKDNVIFIANKTVELPE